MTQHKKDSEMLTLVYKFSNDPSTKNAIKIQKYLKKHPMSVIALNKIEMVILDQALFVKES